ncbi:MAG: 30S ribosomal protein S4 [Candidatus Doudnabacteria bacterium RIFCSPHIGHO2_02_FULL_48_21]|uniref:Small ribosomal subunit protein uS4 n=1 Tax=Candidatus Doudnabacteria bacterium RIFCSPLOWO2_02_FULL_48_13 TaxID=1817845 RepID=A0A1F5Q982_9BACT|nr:MAG: 30S ribosomal protein S4 [Candidatus Doudnabacteria bacterium RIFCSPHIGHO2_01_48_18]OGE77232.1 MAG: 30S ribosomal protein S4 [Candidatus Doudnabacteria bacterium RIFCSPHIGHO2_01_FULL_48_180]OGE91086.1 MAG: 30S ribosomal protein S4 [Candidatus Doudnabacteria bacterium RIFCSPHIGHO2_12_FULL_47_25]OGE93776.1 MAG: 30S ribosomal protein S4 [Candidatus Doudnabacteria bacterium RIFCSPHIGHO2_02_FULL_48_21]OGE97155.1 MAG: 30S ribosomal protein S4 [Candidatus Doudnabacteria bacterium RIFCSPLOWO2_0
MRTTGPKTRKARRIGEPLRDKDAKYLVKRNYAPGMHGQNRARLSEFAIHHKEKQKAKWIYDVTERQFSNYVKAAMRKKAMTGDMLLQFLESRLDNIVYRLGFAASRAQGRQIVGHGFITVDGKKVNIPSFQVSTGAVIEINPNKRTSKYVEKLQSLLKEHKTQEWLELDAKNLKGRVLSKPTPTLIGSTIQMDLIVEHYNR